MTCSVIPKQKEKCVFLTFTGDMRLAEMTTAWREVQIMLGELGWKRVLLDVMALQNDPDTAELFDLAKFVWCNFPKSGRMALVVRWDQSTHAKLFETLLRSVGVYLTVFVSEEQAKAWVLEDPRSNHRLPAWEGASPCHAA